MASPQANQPPWCFLLAEHLHFGAVTWWAPSDMLRLRATCRALRGPSNTSAYLLTILAEGLGWTRYATGVELAEQSLHQLFCFCSRLYSERLLLCSLPQTVRQAAGVSESIDATPYAIIGGSFALHRYLLHSEDPNRRPRWEPDDLDVFIPFGCAHDSPAEEVARSGAVLTAVQQTVSELLPLLQEHVTEILVTTRGIRGGEYPDELDDPFAQMGMSDEDEEETETELSRQTVTATVAPPLTRFEEPEQPKLPHSYTRQHLRAVGQMPFPLIVPPEEDGGEEDGGGLHAVETRDMLERAHKGLGRLFRLGMLDGDPQERLGRSRPYKIARCVDVETRHATGGAERGLRVDYLREDFGWAFPKKVNIVQYHGPPLAPIELVAGFDLLPPQVAVVVAAGAARARFDVPEDAMSAISHGELRFGRYTFSPSYSGAAPLDLLRAARNQLKRIYKYQARGFKLTKTDGERVGTLSTMD